MDSLLRTFVLTLTAKLALLGIDVGEVGVHGDGLELADLHAFLASDTTNRASLARLGALVLVVTQHYHTAVLQPFQANLNDAARTSLGAGTAGGTFLFVHLWQTRFGIHANGIELTGCHAVATTKATKGTSRFTAAQHLLHTATLGTVELCNTRTALARTVTSHHGDFRSTGLGLHAKDVSYLLHHGLSTYGAEQSFERALVGSLHAGSGEARTARETTTATVRLRQHSSNLPNALVFMHSEFLGSKEQDERTHQSNGSKNNHCNQDYIHVFLFLVIY